MKKIFSLLTISASLISIPSVSYAVSASFGEVTFSSFNWEVREKIDSMTDKLSCIILLTDEKGRVQANNSALYIATKGTPRGYKTRINSKPVSNLQLVSKIEEKTKSLAFKGDFFNELLKADRLRVEYSTYTTSSNFVDIPLKGLSNAVEYYKQKNCPRH